MSKKVKIIIAVLVLAAIAGTIYYFVSYKPKKAKLAAEQEAKAKLAPVATTETAASAPSTEPAITEVKTASNENIKVIQ